MVVQAALGDIVYGPVGVHQMMCKHAIKVLCRQATCNGSQLTEALVLSDEALPAQNVCPKVCVTPPQPARHADTAVMTD